MKRTILAGVLTAGALALTGCGSSGHPGNDHTGSMMSAMPGMSATGRAAASGRPASGPHNAADVEFATNMIPHHAQAVYMAQLARQHAATTRLRDLATKVKSAQAPEIAQMSGWLAGWDKPVPSSSYAPGTMGGMSMPGMMSEHDMTMLADASGTGFDRRWLQMMISHHRGAIGMAKTELASGQNPTAKALARSIIAAQTAEITTMNRMLTTLPQ